MLVGQALEGPVLYTQIVKGGATARARTGRRPGAARIRADLRELTAGRRAPFFIERDDMGSRLRIYAAHFRGRRRDAASRGR